MCRYLPKDFGESGSSLYDHVESHAVGLATLRVFPRVGSPYSCTMSQKYSHNCDLSLNTRRTDSIPSWCYCSWYLWCSPRQEKTCSSFPRLDVSSFKSLSFDSAGNTLETLRRVQSAPTGFADRCGGQNFVSPSACHTSRNDTAQTIQSGKTVC